jgi:hypothetical protein
LFEESGLLVGVVQTLNRLAMGARAQGKLAVARSYLGESATRMGTMDHPVERAHMLLCLGEIEAAEGRQSEAGDALAEGLELAYTLGAALTEATALYAVAASALGDARVSLRLCGCADSIRARSGAVPGALQQNTRTAIEGRARRELDEAAILDEVARGAGYGSSEGYTEAMALLTGRTRAPRDSAEFG